jgi:ABC-type transport system substrate-binding protein
VGEGADKHLEVTHKIKAGWRWTDGTPVTTKDVLYNWKLIMDP